MLHALNFPYCIYNLTRVWERFYPTMHCSQSIRLFSSSSSICKFIAKSTKVYEVLHIFFWHATNFLQMYGLDAFYDIIATRFHPKKGSHRSTPHMLIRNEVKKFAYIYKHYSDRPCKTISKNVARQPQCTHTVQTYSVMVRVIIHLGIRIFITSCMEIMSIMLLEHWVQRWDISLLKLPALTVFGTQHNFRCGINWFGVGLLCYCACDAFKCMINVIIMHTHH